MQPSTGRFAGMDPWTGGAFEPPTLHRYLYAGSDPSNKFDPTGLEFNLPSTLSAISGGITVALGNFGATLANAFRQGGPVLGQFFHTIGRFAQDKAVETVRAFAQGNPQLIVEESKQAGTRILDIFVRSGSRAAYIEVKWGLPWRVGESMTRLISQINSGLAAAEGEMVVWTLRLPTPPQARLVTQELGTNAGRVTFVHGFDAWVAWMRNFAGL